MDIKESVVLLIKEEIERGTPMYVITSKLGMSPSTLNNIMYKHNYTVKQLEKICAGLGVEIKLEKIKKDIV